MNLKHILQRLFRQKKKETWSLPLYYPPVQQENGLWIQAGTDGKRIIEISIIAPPLNPERYKSFVKEE